MDRQKQLASEALWQVWIVVEASASKLEVVHQLAERGGLQLSSAFCSGACVVLSRRISPWPHHEAMHIHPCVLGVPVT